MWSIEVLFGTESLKEADASVMAIDTILGGPDSSYWETFEVSPGEFATIFRAKVDREPPPDEEIALACQYAFDVEVSAKCKDQADDGK